MRLSEIKPEDLENVQLTAPSPAINEAGKIEVELPDGGRGFIAPDMQERAISDGLRIIGADEKQRELDLEDADDSNLMAAAAGAIRGITLGTSDLALTKMGIVSPQRLKDLQEANPFISGGAEIAGTIAPALFSGGASLGARALSLTPTALAELAGRKVATKLTGKFLSNTTSNVIKKASTGAFGSAVDGSLFGVGKLISEDALGDAEFNAENALASMGEGALIGGVFGGVVGAGGEYFKKGIKAAGEKTKEALKGFIDNEIGFLKSAGAEKGHIKQILKKESLTTKDLNEYAMDIGKGFEDSADDILINGGLKNKGSKTLKEAVVTSIDDLDVNNQVVRDGAGKLMGDALDKAQTTYLARIESGTLKKEDLLFGDDLADFIEKEFVEDVGDLYSPGKAEFDKLIGELRNVNVTRDALGNTTQKAPLTPIEMKQQSKIFAKEAGFAKLQPSRLQEAHQRLWGKMEDHIGKVLESTDSGLSSQYKGAKKLFEKSITLEKILESGRSKAVNNRGMSLTQGLATVAGGAVGGLPGAVVGYALRKAQMEYGDKAASFLLRKIETASNKGKIGISDAVDSFFKTTQKAGQISNRAGLKYLTGQDITEKKEKDIQEQIEIYSRDPAQVVDNFVKNNQEMLTSAPKTAQALQARVLVAAQFLNSKIPKQDDSPFKDTPKSRSEIMKFKNYVEAVENPYKALDNLKHGYFSPESMEAMKVVYPKMFSAIREEMVHRLPEFKKISEKQKAEISKILGIETKKAYSPQGFAQLQGISSKGVQSNMQEPARASAAAKNIKSSDRSQSGFERVLAR